MTKNGHYVTIEFRVDPAEYVGVKDTPKGVADLVLQMLNAEADWPSKVNVTVRRPDGSLKGAVTRTEYL